MIICRLNILQRTVELSKLHNMPIDHLFFAFDVIVSCYLDIFFFANFHLMAVKIFFVLKACLSYHSFLSRKLHLHPFVFLDMIKYLRKYLTV